MPASRGPRTVLITGASAGLGAALALEYAEGGRVLALVGRRPALLEAVAAECRAKGAEAVTGVVDVTDWQQCAAWISDLDARSPLDLVIVNAGLFDGIRADARLETLPAAQALIRTNLEGAIATATAAAESMRRRGRGHIALVASLAARFPLADAPVYTATKAGLAAYGEALRERLAPEGVRVSVVLPGHVDTAQTAIQRGPLPGLMRPEAAARIIRRRLDRGRPTIAFPGRVSVLASLSRLLPWRLRALAGRSQRFTVDAPERDSR